MKAMTIVAVMVVSCVHGGTPSGDEGRKSGDALTLARYVWEMQVTHVNDTGRIPTDLSGSMPDQSLDNPAIARQSNDTPGLDLNRLAYIGVSSKGMCLLYRDRLAPDATEPAAAIAKRYQDELVANPVSGMWLALVDSLSSVKTLAPWPPPPSGSRVDSVEVVGDEQVTISDKRRAGGGDYVEVKHDYRIVSLSLCAPKPETSGKPRFLVAVRHLAPGSDDVKLEADGANRNDVQMQHATIFVWAITDDGKFDLGPPDTTPAD